MQYVLDATQRGNRLRPKQPMRIGDDADQQG
jgi:hypothetical protein